MFGKRPRSDRPKARAARLAAIGLVAGALAGGAAAGDIESSYQKGRIAGVRVSATSAAAPPLPAAASRDELDLARTHGFALAAQLGFASRADCASVAAELREGCIDYVLESDTGTPADVDL